MILIITIILNNNNNNLKINHKMMMKNHLFKNSKKILKKIKEELETDIKVGELIGTIEYDYPAFHLSMDCFWCEIINGALILKEHEDAKWLTKDKLDSVEWLPADLSLIKEIKKYL